MYLQCNRCTYSATDVPTVQQMYLRTVQQMYVQCNRFTYSATDVPTVQQMYLQCNRCTYSATDVPTVQQMYPQCNRCTYSATDVPTVQQMYLQCVYSSRHSVPETTLVQGHASSTRGHSSVLSSYKKHPNTPNNRAQVYRNILSRKILGNRFLLFVHYSCITLYNKFQRRS